MSDFLADLYADLLADEQDRPRSQQVEIGGSGLFGCRAEHVLRLNGVPQSDPRLSWEAFVGSAIDHRIGEARLRRNPDLLVQLRVEYAGVWFTIDEFDPATKTLRDWKSKDSAAACGEAVAMMVEDRPGHEQKRAQLHGGAAGLIAAGYEVEQIQLVFLPRAGSFDGARLFTESFSREWADKGTEWAAEVIGEARRVADAIDADLAAILDEPDNGPSFAGNVDILDFIPPLRDKPPFFCQAYCPFVTTCRGEGEVDTVDPDPQILDAAQRFVIAKLEYDEAEARKNYYRDLLRGAPAVTTDGWRVGWSRDTRSEELVPDLDAVDVEQYEFVIGRLPRKVKVTGKAPSLTPRKVRGK